MSYIIIADSSSNIYHMEGVNYKTVPLHIIMGDTDCADVPGLDIDDFNRKLYAFQGKTTTSCPSPEEWMEAFGDNDNVFCVTISSNLSGSYSCALAAKEMYEEKYPGRKVYVMDSLATGPRMVLMTEHLLMLLREGTDPETAYRKTVEFRNTTGLLFTLESIQMLARAGRVSPVLAKAIGILDIRMLGTASSEGTVELISKHRGYQKSIIGTFKQMLKDHYEGGKVVISHNTNEKAATDLAAMIKEKFDNAMIDIHRTTALCSYYAEKGGIIIGYERGKSVLAK